MTQKKSGFFRFIKNLGNILSQKPQLPPSLEDNSLLQVILNRRSVRRFSADEIPDDVFSAILEAGRLAPSTVNLQSWTFAVFTASSWQEKFDRPIPFRGNRALIVMGDAHRDRLVLDAFPQSPLIEYTIAVMNASLAAMNMNIAAEALGVASVMLSETGRSGVLDARYLSDKLLLPQSVFPIMTIIFGYPKGNYPAIPPKLPIETITFTDGYKEADLFLMQSWLDQMKAGYKASHILSSFDAQLKVYQKKIGQAEADLEAMIYAKARNSSEGE